MAIKSRAILTRDGLATTTFRPPAEAAATLLHAAHRIAAMVAAAPARRMALRLTASVLEALGGNSGSLARVLDEVQSFDNSPSSGVINGSASGAPSVERGPVADGGSM